MTNDIDTLATALYGRTDDLLKQYPDPAPWRPKIGLQPRLTDAELVTLAVLPALLGYTSKARWIRHAQARLGHLFRSLPGPPGYHRRLRAAAGLITTPIRVLAADTILGTDDVWVAAFHPGGMRPLPRNRPPLGPGRVGRLRVLRLPFAAPSGACGCTWPPPSAACPPPARSPAPKPTNGRPCFPSWPPARTWPPPGPGTPSSPTASTYGTSVEAALAAQRLRLLRPARNGEPERAGAHLFTPLRQTIESIGQTFKAQLDLERHGGHTPAAVLVRVLQRILALTAAIWHNDHTGAPVHRSLTAYDH